MLNQTIRSKVDTLWDRFFAGGIANPLAAILTAGMLLSHLGRPELEARVKEAVRGCLLADEVTPELGGRLSTRAVGDAVLARLA